MPETAEAYEVLKVVPRIPAERAPHEEAGAEDP